MTQSQAHKTRRQWEYTFALQCEGDNGPAFSFTSNVAAESAQEAFERITPYLQQLCSTLDRPVGGKGS